MALLNPKDTKEPKTRESNRFELIDFLFCPSLSDPLEPSIQLFVCFVFVYFTQKATVEFK